MTKMAKSSEPAASAATIPAADVAAIDARDFRKALGSYATGVTIITAQAGDGRIVGLTCNSFASVSLNPAMVLWSLGIHSPSMQIFQEASHFAVNVLGENQAELAQQFARSAADKFVGVSSQPGLGGAPLIDGCIANFQCRNAYRYYGGDHIIFLGAVEAYTHSRDEPLLFARGVFGGFERAKP
jgi:flavin reductase (DIM6/NTAB) family NADH-FMN oxidoreductase RutF